MVSVQLNMSVLHGELLVVSNGVRGALVSLSGNMNDLQDVLSNVTYIPAGDYVGDDTVSFELRRSVGAQALSDSMLLKVIRAPVITYPPVLAAAVEDVPLQAAIDLTVGGTY